MNSYYNQIIDYSCINDYEGVTPQLSKSTGLLPGKSLSTEQHNFLFERQQPPNNNNNNNDNNNNNNNNDCQSSPIQHNLNQVGNYNKYKHQNHPSRCDHNWKIVEQFQNNSHGLLNTVPVMNSRIGEANRNLRVILATDSSLDDYQQMENQREKAYIDKKYIKKQENQNNKMEKINKLITDVEILRLESMKELKNLQTIQSKVSGKKLAVKMVGNNNEFLIKANNQCLSYTNDNKYKLQNCNQNNKKQMFGLKPISTSNDYRHVLNEPINEAQLKNVKYPFYVVQPSNNSKQCLYAGDQNNSAMISIEPCKINDNQQWSKSTNKSTCQQ
jgi:hypothetical protein